MNHAERVKDLAGDYAHCYAFVKDETMPLKHAELHKAIDAMQSALDDAVAKLAARDAEVERFRLDRSWSDGKLNDSEIPNWLVEVSEEVKGGE